MAAVIREPRLAGESMPNIANTTGRYERYVSYEKKLRQAWEKGTFWGLKIITLDNHYTIFR